MKLKLKKTLIQKSSTWFLLGIILTLTGCESLRTVKSENPIIMPTTRVVEKATWVPPKMAPTRAQFLMTQSSEIQKAYQRYEKSGKAPTIATDDFLQFPYGDSQPLIYCQPMRACDIELEKNEVITGVYLGDTARWNYEQAVSGEANERQYHVIFKPKDYELATNAIITTTRRTYHVGLISKADAYVKQVRFWYPGDIQAQWAKANNDAQMKWQADNQTQIAELPTLDITKMDFNYEIPKPYFSRLPAWWPLRAFNDGTHVFIEMSPGMRTADAPVLFIVNSEGKRAVVNYRVRQPYFIVDSLFKQAVLVAGVGSSQQQAIIYYRG